MRIIPPEPSTATQSHGGRRLHHSLREASDQPDQWQAIHALALAHHGYKPTSEAGFVLIGAPGIFVLEVKGGTISRRDGVWYSTSRQGHDHRLGQSPFDQAQGAAHAINRWLTAALPEFGRWDVRFGHGVAFPDCPFPYHDPGRDPAQVLASDHVETASGIECFLHDFAAYWTRKLPRKAPLTPARIEAITTLLAGDLGRRPSDGGVPTGPVPAIVDPAFAGLRGQVVDFLQNDLVGPWLGPDEVLADSPLRRYVAGVLFPRPQPLAEPDDTTEPESELGAVSGGEAGQEDQSEQPIAAAYAQRPSSLGVSFVVSGPPAIRVQVRAATYERATAGADPADFTVAGGDTAGDGQSAPEVSAGWRRRALVDPPAAGEGYALQPAAGRQSRLPVLGGRGILTAHWRPLRHGTLVTVSLSNAAQGSTDTSLTEPAACLYQVELACFPAAGSAITAYPRFERLTDDPEERELALLYRREEHFAVGHGCGAQWHPDPADRARITAVTSATLPTHELAPVTYDLAGMDETLSFFALSELSGVANDTIAQRLRIFATGYARWAASLPTTHTDIPAPLMPTRNLIFNRIADTVERIAAGIRVLQNTPHAMRAFRLMNEAMLRQRLAGTPSAGAADLQPFASFRWRPFQLAFILLSLPSLTNPEHPDRKLVDLLWFPTGGGKTEAYLGVIGFLLCWRRLADPRRAGGTTAIMRYTLRLLTTQQFLRAAKLICAGEFMRREQYPELGDHSITLGLWIGGSLTPNQYRIAGDRLKKVLSGEEAGNPFVLDTCPWCATPLLAADRDRADEATPIGFLASESAFVVRCPDPACIFHRELPVQVVDEALYAAPPSLLLATVDKFAMVTWEERAGVFFGDADRRAPDLVVQDELHLIAGPLGTMVGLYETAIDGIITGQGAPAKLIASTATIRGAEAQVKRLYGRAMRVFPPPGLTADDSYFARRDDTKPGRLYLGIMPASISDATASVRLTAALLQAPMTLPAEDREAYWTLVSYHNNLRGVGRGLSLAADEIPLHIEFLARSLLAAAREHSPDALAEFAAGHPALARQLARGQDTGAAPMTDRALAALFARDISDATAELTSNIKAAALGDMLARLEAAASNPRAISLLLCTNMLSVGVDVPRLALMLMHGQPKSTAEYIQATSRVGRGDVPGLVVCLYSSLRPRDRSHYEHFAGFHAAFYREVEATPVTPFAAPARERALPAVLVSLARHRAGVAKAHQFVPDADSITDLITMITDRVGETDPAEADATAAQLAELVDDWAAQTRRPGQLRYGTAGAALGPPVAIPTLLAAPNNLGADGWPTPMSMRTVEGSVPLRVLRRDQ